jgi:hypothetical protein
MFGPPNSRILKWIVRTDFHQESSKTLRIWMPVSAHPLNQWQASSHLKLVTNHKQTISDFLQQPIPRVHKDQMVMKARVRTTQFLRVQVTVKVGWGCNPRHCIGLNSACLFNTRCTSIVRNCMLWFVFPQLAEVSWRIPYRSFALLWTPIFMLSQLCNIETHNEDVIKCCGVYKIVFATS